MRNPYHLAHYINGMKPGQCLKISRDQVNDLVGTHPLLPSGRSGWEIVLDNVVGSAYPHIWEFDENPIEGSITVRRKDETAA